MNCMKIVTCAALLLLLGMPAYASIIPAKDVILEDNDWELAISNKAGGATTLEPGDVLVAMYEIQRVVDAGTSATLATFSPSTKSITGISVLQVSAIKVVDVSATFQIAYYLFVPYTGEWSDLGLGLSDVNDNTMVTMYEDPASAPANHLDQFAASYTASLATATNGTLLYEFGYSEGTKTYDNGTPLDLTDDYVGPFDPSTELWTAMTYDLNTGNATDITAIDSLEFSAGLNVTKLLSVPLVKITDEINDHFTPDPNYFITSDYIVGGTDDKPPTQPVGIFPLATDNNMRLHPVPEPVSLLAWVGLAACGSVLAARRRRAE